MNTIDNASLISWCRIPYKELEEHPDLKIPFRLCLDSEAMGRIMARELVNEISEHNRKGESTRAIIPCGPSCWYKPFVDIVNNEKIDLQNLIVFHMDECLDWEGKELSINHPFSFRGIMERVFYGPIGPDLNVLEKNRHFLNSHNIDQIHEEIWSEPIDITYGGWGQDGHIAYNQARRHPFNHISIDQLRNSTVRIQNNNPDTLIALAHRNFGCAYQLVPPMSVTLGVKECLSAKKVRLFSDTGAWKQTALRVALFSPVTPEYPITLLQEHPDALLTATVDTANHPISEHPEWDFGISSD